MAPYDEEYYECDTCAKLFPAGRYARDDHCRATDHLPPEFECDTCPRWFGSQQACNQHMRDKSHSRQVSDMTGLISRDWVTHEGDRRLHQSGLSNDARNYSSINTVCSTSFLVANSLVTRW
jgi:hypothetical protein